MTNLQESLSPIGIGKLTKKIVWQSIILFMSIKMMVLALFAGGKATLWNAVIADAAPLAMLNAVRVKKMKL